MTRFVSIYVSHLGITRLNHVVYYIALQENARAFDRFFFHARVMRPVSKCDPSTKILGYDSSIPVFVSGASSARLGHPLGLYSQNLLDSALGFNMIIFSR
jgi:hypothetical protein